MKMVDYDTESINMEKAIEHLESACKSLDSTYMSGRKFVIGNIEIQIKLIKKEIKELREYAKNKNT